MEEYKYAHSPIRRRLQQTIRENHKDEKSTKMKEIFCFHQKI